MKHSKLRLARETVRVLASRELTMRGGIITGTDSVLCSVGTCTTATLGCPDSSTATVHTYDRANPCHPTMDMVCPP